MSTLPSELELARMLVAAELDDSDLTIELEGQITDRDQREVVLHTALNLAVQLWMITAGREAAQHVLQGFASLCVEEES